MAVSKNCLRPFSFVISYIKLNRNKVWGELKEQLLNHSTDKWSAASHGHLDNGREPTPLRSITPQQQQIYDSPPFPPIFCWLKLDLMLRYGSGHNSDFYLLTFGLCFLSLSSFISLSFFPAIFLCRCSFIVLSISSHRHGRIKTFTFYETHQAGKDQSWQLFCVYTDVGFRNVWLFLIKSCFAFYFHHITPVTGVFVRVFKTSCCLHWQSH